MRLRLLLAHSLWYVVLYACGKSRSSYQVAQEVSSGDESAANYSVGLVSSANRCPYLRNTGLTGSTGPTTRLTQLPLFVKYWQTAESSLTGSNDGVTHYCSVGFVHECDRMWIGWRARRVSKSRRTNHKACIWLCTAGDSTEHVSGLLPVIARNPYTVIALQSQLFDTASQSRHDRVQRLACLCSFCPRAVPT